MVLAACWATAHAQVPPVASQDQLAMLKSDDPHLARNKRLVFDFWRIVYEGGHMDQAPKYMAETYIQHNPNADTGLAGFKAYFTRLGGPLPVKDTLDDLVAIQAEGNYVTLSFVRPYDDPANKGQKYTTTWFDMFRIDNGKIAEHWDCATKAAPPAAK